MGDRTANERIVILLKENKAIEGAIASKAAGVIVARILGAAIGPGRVEALSRLLNFDCGAARGAVPNPIGKTLKLFSALVPQERFELPTPSLRMTCSTS